MSWSEASIQRIKEDRKEQSYVVVTIKPPLANDLKKAITSYWNDCCGDFLSIANDPLSRQKFLSDMKWSEDRLNLTIYNAQIQFFDYFPLIGFLIKKDKVDELRRLHNVEYVYEVPHDFGIDYINIIKGLHYTLENKSKVANISLQPPEPYPFNEKEAMNIASRILSDSGVIVVIAAGNFGDRRGNSMNPWSVAPWVIGVGAAHSNGKKLWKYSSKGIAGDQLYHPTVVAPGVDIRSCGPDGKYTIESGTSCATAYVSGIALRLVEFINNIVKSPIISEWKNIAKTRFGTKIRPIQPYPYVIKMMIEDMAVEMPGYKRHEVGSGFIDENTATKYFKDFDLSDFIKLFAFNKKG